MLILSSVIVTAPVNGSGNKTDKSIDARKIKIKKKLKNIEERIALSQEAENEETAQSLSLQLSQLRERTNKLKEIEIFYNRQLTALKKQSTLEKEKEILNKSIKTVKDIDISQKPPYSLSFYDDYLAILNESQRNKQTAEMALKLYDRSLKEDRQQLKETSQKLRLQKEEYEKKKDSDEIHKLAWLVEMAEIEEELAKAMLNYQEIVFSNAQKESEQIQIKVDTAQKNVTWISRHLSFDKADLNKQNDTLDKQKGEFEKEIKIFAKKQQNAELACIDAQKKLDKASSEEEKSLAQTALTTNELWQKAYQYKVEHRESMIQLTNQQQEIWKKRYDLLIKKPDYVNLSSWRKEVRDEIEEITRNIRFQQNLQTNLQLQIAKIEKQLLEENLKEAIKSQLNEQHTALRTISEDNFYFLAVLNTTHQLYLRFVNELNKIQKGVAYWNKALSAMSTVYSIWTFEVVVIDNRSVTVGKIVIAFLIFVLGLFLSKRLTRMFHSRVFSRMRLKESTAAVLEKLFYYLTVLLVVLIALRIVNIPLTAFAFLGGAVAIGVGFGAQKLMNNFISGFILMAEQPVKVGDLIEMDGNVGIIEDIGVRSTRVRIKQSMHILVPNSYFLENNIVNWTHYDNKVRCEVVVGVIYGSPVEEVKKLLLRAALEHQTILKYPDPFVLFNDFGADALIFSLNFWIVMRRVIDRHKVESDLRFSIEQLFKEAQLVIAFPQRDVHLDTTKPLQLQIVKPHV